MKDLQIKTIIQEFLIEHVTNNKLILYHGSNSTKIFNKILNNQFFSINDYLAASYAYNLNGLLYQVEINNLNYFELQSFDKHENPDKYEDMVVLLTTLYNKNIANNYIKRYFTPSPTYTFEDFGWQPIIDYCKEQGYNSIKFIDESFDKNVRDVSYLIFDGNKCKILNIYNIDDNFNLIKIQ